MIIRRMWFMARVAAFVLCVLALSLLMGLLSSCSDAVELCEVRHPHKAFIEVKHDWTGVNSSLVPDSMLVFAERLVQRWNCGYMVSMETNQSKRIYTVVSDDDESVEAGGDAEASQEENASSDAGTRQATGGVLPYATLGVRPGEYEIMSFSRNVSEFNYKGMEKYIDDRSDSTCMDSIYVEYKSYDKSDLRLKRYISSWTDFNPYSKYVQSNAHPFFYSITDPVECPMDSRVPLTMKPRSFMQGITLRFSVEKRMDADSRFVIDSMHVEMSGIPHRVYLMNGNVDVTKTYKMLLQPIYLQNKDSYSNKKMQCEAFFSAPGIVPPINQETALGPGIAVVKVFLHTEKRPHEAYMVNARINLFRTISKSPLIKMNDDMTAGVLRSQYHVINVTDVMQLNAKEIIRSAEDNESGIDRWESCGKGTVVDI